MFYLLFIILILILAIIKMFVTIYKLKDKINLLEQFTDNDLWLIGERLKYMTPYQFEETCAKLLSYKPDRFAYTRPLTRDGGVDIVLTEGSQTIFIECKHWLPTDENKSSVGREIGQKLKGAMDYGFDGRHSINKGMIITTSNYTKDCEIYCKSMGIGMWGVDDILELVRSIGTKEVYKDFGIDYDGKYTVV